MKELLLEMQKVKPDNIDSEEIFSFVEVILRNFDYDDSEDHETNQVLIGIRDLFRGYTVKAWSRTSFSDRKCHNLNKNFGRLCVKHCYKCQIDRNKACHNETVQKERTMNCCKKVKESMTNFEYPQVKSFARRNKLNENNTSPYVMQQ